MLRRREALGVAVELVSDVLVVAGLTGQRLATLPASGTSSFEASTTARSSSRSCWNGRWVLAFLVYALGQSLELAALGLASESTVVAVGNLGLVFNALASVWVFGEDFCLFRPPKEGRSGKSWDGLNLALLILGSACTVVFAPQPSKSSQLALKSPGKLREMWMEFPFVYCNFAFLGAFAVLAWLAWRNFASSSQQPKAPMFLASCVAILSAYSVTLSKVVTELAQREEDDGDGAFTFGILVVWIFSLVAQVVLVNVGLQNFEQGVFVPMFETLSTSLTIVFGVLYFKSYQDFRGTGRMGGFCLGVATLVLGLFLTSRRAPPSREEMVANLRRRTPRSSRLGKFTFSSQEEELGGSPPLGGAVESTPLVVPQALL